MGKSKNIKKSIKKSIKKPKYVIIGEVFKTKKGNLRVKKSTLKRREL